MECFTCKSNLGNKRISPGPTIYDGEYWLVEHAYPSKLKGWLVIATKRHVEKLHKLSSEEFIELTKIMEKTIKLLHEKTNCEKEYSMCLAEKEGFNHIHFHIVPKPKDLSDELKGAKCFGLLKVTEEEAIPKEDIKVFCEELKRDFENTNL